MDVTAVFNQAKLRKLTDLVPYARNARKHSPENLATIKGSIREFGFTNPVLADEKGIVAGHGRVMSATELLEGGHTICLPDGTPLPDGYIPVIDCTGWSETKRRAYILIDNQSALTSSWDMDLLKLELEELKVDGFDMDLLGFGDDLTSIMDPVVPPGKDPDDVPKVPEVPHSKLGDVWILGPHRIVCGDSTDITVWDKVMQGELADACWTDPPYNVAYESDLAGSIKNDSMSSTSFLELLVGMHTAMFTMMKEGASIYVAHADTEGYNFRAAFKAAGFKLSGCLVWRKDSLVLGRSPYQWIHEPILFGWKPGAAPRWFGGRKQTTVADFGQEPFEQDEDGRWIIRSGDRVLVVDGAAQVEQMEGSLVFEPKPKRSALHPTTKPTGLICQHLKNSARANDIVIDCCGGSGSTMIAAEMMGMCARLVELDPKFTDVQCARYFAYTGRLPVHAETGESFPRGIAEALCAK